MKEQVVAFFEGYAETFRHYQVEHLAEYYHIPCMMMSSHHKQAITQPEQLNQYISTLFSKYREIALAELIPDVDQYFCLSEKVFFVTVKWRFQGADEQELFSCQSSYTLQDNGDDLRIVAAVVDDEELEYEKMISVA